MVTLHTIIVLRRTDKLESLSTNYPSKTLTLLNIFTFGFSFYHSELIQQAINWCVFLFVCFFVVVVFFLFFVLFCFFFLFFLIFYRQTGFDMSCKSSPLETICMKCIILFFWGGKINKYFKISSAESVSS